MDAKQIRYQTRRALVLAARAKGPQRRLQERALWQARLNAYLLEHGLFAVRTISFEQYKREFGE